MDKEQVKAKAKAKAKAQGAAAKDGAGTLVEAVKDFIKKNPALAAKVAATLVPILLKVLIKRKKK